jgi:uncharacterized protein with FMN-binding domain
MQKVLLSLAVIAASGAYVAYEDHAGQSLAHGLATAEAVVPQQPALLLHAPAPAAPAQATIVPASTSTVYSAAQAVAPTAPATQPPAPRKAAIPAWMPQAPPDRPSPDVAGVASSEPPADSDPATAADAAETSPVPLPRPRPADAPVADDIAQVAASSRGQGQYMDGTYTGSSANAYYGRVQVQAVVQGGQLARVKVLNYPSDRGRSRYINSQALPMLEQEAIQAQSADLDVVSGATLTSHAYMQSLDAALSKAHGNNA